MGWVWVLGIGGASVLLLHILFGTKFAGRVGKFVGPVLAPVATILFGLSFLSIFPTLWQPAPFDTTTMVSMIWIVIGASFVIGIVSFVLGKWGPLRSARKIDGAKSSIKYESQDEAEHLSRILPEKPIPAVYDSAFRSLHTMWKSGWFALVVPILSLAYIPIFGFQTSCFCPHFSGRFQGNHNGIERLTYWFPVVYAVQGCCSVSNFRGTAQVGSAQGVALPPH